MNKVILLFLFFTFQVGNAQEAVEIIKGPDNPNILTTNDVEVVPVYTGGINEFYKFVGRNFKVPNVSGLSGKVYVSFVVEKNGKLADIKVLRDIGYDTGKEAIRVLKKCKKWLPGEQNGKKVRVIYSLPISIVTN